MHITKLYTDLLDSIVQAQYNAYVFSENLGEQVKDNLFPIPVAEIREITLDIRYAYAKDSVDPVTETEVVWALFYKNIEPLLSEAAAEYRKRMVAEIAAQTDPDEHWLVIRSNLATGSLDTYAMTLLEEKFYDNADRIVRNTQVNLPFLAQLLSLHLDEVMLHNTELEKYTQGLNLAPLLTGVTEHQLRKKREELQTGLDTSIKKKRKQLDIIIDAAELKSLPPEAIQHARVVLDVRSVLNEKEKQS